MSVVHRRPRVGFVLERSLGHVTHADNLTRLLRTEDRIEAEILPIEFGVDGFGAFVPVFKSNWTIRAGARARRSIRRAHRSEALDALFIHTQVPAILATNWVGRLPTVLSLDATPLQYDELGEHYGHETGNPRVEKLKWRANRASLQRASQVVAWSAWTKQGVVEGYGIDPDKVLVIPPGVIPEVWRPTDPRAVDDGPTRILFVGADLERKGGDVLLRAFQELRVQRSGALAPGNAPDIELHLVTRSHVPTTPGVIVHRSLGPNSPELVALYHSAAIFCLPTRSDCLPMVLSEAGAAGLPLVSTAIAGIPEIVRDGETGVVVPPDDVGALVQALRTLVESPELRRRLGAGAQELVSRDYDADKNTRLLVDLVADLASTERTAVTA